MKDLKDLCRENIWNLAPYSCARTEFAGRNARVFLDANENPYNDPYNRYPDPLQVELKKQISKIKGVAEEKIFLGNGSDEAIDLVYRVFCRPGNDVEYRSVLLDENYQISAGKLLAACDEQTKVIWFCSPNNPTGNHINREAIVEVLQKFQGIVIIDEAYADFSSERTFRSVLDRFPNMIVLNTMSKAWGCAALRLGMAFASKEIVDIFNKVKYPYNVNLLTQEQALEVLKNPLKVDEWVKNILQERSKVMAAFMELPICEKVYPTDANFFLAKMTDANAIYDYLVAQGIIVRNRNKVQLCGNCLRITIGNKSENAELLGALRQY